MKIGQTLESLWYGGNRLAFLLLPFSGLFQLIVLLRRALYALGVLSAEHLPVPVIVVGNVSVGGTGKTPLIIWLSHYLRKQGYKPGIVSRGYGGHSQHWPQQVRADSDPDTVGDEAVLLARRSGCPVAVAPKRVQAARQLIAEQQCDIILCDDGLQHYALHREIEIVVIDGVRRFGNGFHLPAGPLREPVSRIASCDIIVAKAQALPHEFLLSYESLALRSLQGGHELELENVNSKQVHAVAGIGNPDSFFFSLRQAGFDIRKHIFPDHYRYRQADFVFAEEENAKAIIMTEKDAVKCQQLTLNNAWYLPVNAHLSDAFISRLNHLLEEKING